MIRIVRNATVKSAQVKALASRQAAPSAEVESVVRGILARVRAEGMPAVLECAVTGVPDPIRGQIVKATVVLKDGYQPSDELKKELQNFVKKETAPYKYPRALEFVKELPKTVNGKIMRSKIRKDDGLV